EALLFEAPAEDAVEHGGVDGAVLQRLHLNALIADHLKLNPVALLVKTEVLEPEHDAHPDRAADAGDAEAFAAQILGPLDRSSGHQIVGVAAGKRRDHF